MASTKGYYSLIQFCPDRSRLEAANIGVLLFCPDRRFLRVRVAAHNNRIRRFFGPIPDMDWTQIDAAKIAIEDRLRACGDSFRSLENLVGYVGTRANQVILTEPRPMRVTDPEHELNALFDGLVGDEHGAVSRPTARRLRSRLQRSFCEHHLERYIEHDVEVPIPTRRRTLTVPFAFRNGVFNLVLPETFDLRTIDSIEKKACRIAIEGEYVRKNPHPDRGPMELLIVGEFDGNREASELVQDILAVPEIRIFEAQEVNGLLDLIRDTAEPAREAGPLGF